MRSRYCQQASWCLVPLIKKGLRRSVLGTNSADPADCILLRVRHNRLQGYMKEGKIAKDLVGVTMDGGPKGTNNPKGRGRVRVG